MKWKWMLAGMVLMMSCQNNESYKKADDAEEAGTEFIRASLDGNYEKAKFYLYKDSADFNLRVLDKWKMAYDAMDKEEKSKYHSASIRPIKIEPGSDSTSYSYTYYNSYKKDTTTIMILKASNDWLVDLRDLH
jgi:Asp-tRNA(Asn)/Glu-tRNA(Gln) amidotransferase A subunit family amidase